MNERFKWCAWFSVTVLVAWPWAVRAAGFDCNQADDPVEKTICASPKLSALDARLSAVYATVLARDPARADALKRDERNWLGERDDQAWQILSDPESESHATRVLTDLYRQRIEFLRRLDNPYVVRGSPIVEAVLDAVPSLPKGTSNVLKALQASGLVVLPQEHQFADKRAVIEALPAPPDRELRKEWDTFPDTHYTLVYMPKAGIGGVYFVQGTAHCISWLVFQKSGDHTRSIGKRVRDLGGCGRDGSWSYLALISGHPVAVIQTLDMTTPEVDLRWQRWLGSKWAVPVRVHVRFGYDLAVEVASCDPSLECDKVTQRALDIARRYDRKPLPGTLMDTVSLTSRERVRFLQMVTFAEGLHANLRQQIEARDEAFEKEADFGIRSSPERQAARHRKLVAARQADNVDSLPYFGKRELYRTTDFADYGQDASWFPARLNGELVLGRIGHGYFNGRAGGNWLVGFWRWHEGKLTPIAGVVVDRVNDGVLLAARVKPKPQ